MTTVGLPDASTYTTIEVVSCLIAHRPVPTDQKVDWQQGGIRQINTTGHSTPLTITSVQLNGTGRPVLVHRISVRDKEAVGSNPATPTGATLPGAHCRGHTLPCTQFMKLIRRPPAEAEADYYARVAAKYTGGVGPQLARSAGVRLFGPVNKSRGCSVVDHQRAAQTDRGAIRTGGDTYDH
jgi:hypothetical protein